MQLTDFSYHLPTSSIAQTPAEPRDSSRLLVVDRHTGELSDRHFFELAEILPANAVLVRNNTRVIPARIIGQKATGGHVEILLTRRIGLTPDSYEIWECLTKPGLKLGQMVSFTSSNGATILTATCTAVTDYTREITFNLGKEALFAALYEVGQTPIPPYIHWAQGDELRLRELYQTLYAKVAGSAAAPTAGLHFTPELETRLLAKGIDIAEVTLHVGLGTFLPVKTADITQHHLHKEWFELSAETAELINNAKAAGRPIISVGTTTTRVLETCADSITNQLTAQQGETQIYIYPPYRFRVVDGLITNFHLPQSSLLMLISALASQPNTPQEFENFESSNLGKAYQHAINTGYRFYSFGDAMLIW